MGYFNPMTDELRAQAEEELARQEEEQRLRGERERRLREAVQESFPAQLAQGVDPELLAGMMGAVPGGGDRPNLELRQERKTAGWKQYPDSAVGWQEGPPAPGRMDVGVPGALGAPASRALQAGDSGAVDMYRAAAMGGPMAITNFDLPDMAGSGPWVEERAARLRSALSEADSRTTAPMPAVGMTDIAAEQARAVIGPDGALRTAPRSTRVDGFAKWFSQMDPYEMKRLLGTENPVEAAFQMHRLNDMDMLARQGDPLAEARLIENRGGTVPDVLKARVAAFLKNTAPDPRLEAARIASEPNTRKMALEEARDKSAIEAGWVHNGTNWVPKDMWTGVKGGARSGRDYSEATGGEKLKAQMEIRKQANEEVPNVGDENGPKTMQERGKMVSARYKELLVDYGIAGGGGQAQTGTDGQGPAQTVVAAGEGTDPGLNALDVTRTLDAIAQGHDIGLTGGGVLPNAEARKQVEQMGGLTLDNYNELIGSDKPKIAAANRTGAAIGKKAGSWLRRNVLTPTSGGGGAFEEVRTPPPSAGGMGIADMSGGGGSSARDDLAQLREMTTHPAVREAVKTLRATPDWARLQRLMQSGQLTIPMAEKALRSLVRGGAIKGTAAKKNEDLLVGASLLELFGATRALAGR